MFSTTTIIKNSKFSGKVAGTHQRLDQAARRCLTRALLKGNYFPSSKEILHFEGMRGPDGLKRKSPGVDEPSHMLVNDSDVSEDDIARDTRSVVELIKDYHWNLTQALRAQDHTRAAFEAAWLAHMLTDGLTPAHHFPLSHVQDTLMTDKEMMKIFGQPIKGLMHGRSALETMRNNWLYWGASGHMTKHIAYEYGVLMITAAMPPHALDIELKPEDFQELDIEKIFQQSLERVQQRQIYTRFINDGWTTELARETKEFLLPEIIHTIALGWYSAATAAYHLPRKSPVQSNHSQGEFHA